jgi:Glycosyl hydrolases family 31
MPYLYELCFQSALEAQPIQRWVGWDPYDGDMNMWNDKILRDGERQFFLGDAFLIGGVYEEDVQQTTLYLPTCKDKGVQNNSEIDNCHDDGFISIHSPYEYYSSGQWATLPTPLSNIAVLARVGSVVPVGRPCVTTASPQFEPTLKLDDWRGVEIYPVPWSNLEEDRIYNGTWREDDGISSNGGVSRFELSYECKQESILVRVQCISKEYEVLWGWKVWVILPVGEERQVVVDHKESEAEWFPQWVTDEKGRRTYEVRIEF